MTAVKTLVDLLPRTTLVIPYFLRPQHPKSTIAPTRDAVRSLLDLGFMGQRKANGHRAQIHLSSAQDFACFTRQGSVHTQLIDAEIKTSLVRIFKPKTDWTVIDCEWQKQQHKLYIFDILKIAGKSLKSRTYAERYEEMRELFSLDPHIEFLPLIKTLDGCMEILADKSPFSEGLVFRNPKSPGFDDGAIIRCRKNGVFFLPEKLS